MNKHDRFIKNRNDIRDRIKLELVKDDYSWEDLAVVLCDSYPNDMEELIYMINEQLELKAKRKLARIPHVMELIEQVWLKSPDLRFFQLMFNLQRTLGNKSGDLHYIEDEVLIKELTKMLGNDIL